MRSGVWGRTESADDCHLELAALRQVRGGCCNAEAVASSSPKDLNLWVCADLLVWGGTSKPAASLFRHAKRMAAQEAHSAFPSLPAAVLCMSLPCLIAVVWLLHRSSAKSGGSAEPEGTNIFKPLRHLQAPPCTAWPGHWFCGRVALPAAFGWPTLLNQTAC